MTSIEIGQKPNRAKAKSEQIMATTVDNSVLNFERSTSERFDDVLNHLQDHVEQVRELSIPDGLIDDEQVTVLDDLFRERHADLQLKSLKLRNNSLTSRSSGYLASILQTVQDLEELDLLDNQVKDEGLSRLRSILNQPFCSLKRLNLSNNKLGAGGAVHIASIVGENRSIIELILSRNNFGKKSLKTLSKHLARNPVLERLDLSFNKIKSGGVNHLATVLDATESRSRLVYLDLTQNPISDKGALYLVNALLQGKNKHLRHLNLTRTELTSEGAIYLAHLLKYSYTLEELVVSRNKIGLDGVVELCLGLEDSRDENGSALRRLDLDMNDLDDRAAIRLAEMLRGNDVLKTLSLVDNGIRNEGAAALADSLHSNLTLRHLDLERNQIRDPGAIALAKSICRKSCHLITLGWEKNPMSEIGQGRIEAAFKLRESRRIWLNHSLGEIEKRRHLPINLQHRKLGDEEVIAISQHLAKHRPRVPSLSFSGQLITGRSMKLMAKDLLANNQVNIQRLTLHHTSLLDLGVAALAQALQSNSTLRSISLTKCQVSSEGLQFLSRAIAKNTTLTRLDVVGNQVGDEGALEFFETILDPPHPSLCGVSLANNVISDRGILTLRSFGNLDFLNLSHNRLTDRGVLDLAKAALQPTTKLKVLSISHNYVSSKGIQALQLFLNPDKLEHHGQLTHE